MPTSETSEHFIYGGQREVLDGVAAELHRNVASANETGPGRLLEGVRSTFSDLYVLGPEKADDRDGWVLTVYSKPDVAESMLEAICAEHDADYGGSRPFIENPDQFG